METQKNKVDQFVPMKHLMKGIGLSLFAWFASTIMVLLARYAQTSISLPMVLFFQNGIGLIAILPFAIKSHPKLARRVPYGTLIIRCLFGQSAVLFQFLSVNFLDLTKTMLFTNTAPILLPFIGFIWLRNKIKPLVFPGIIIGFIGIYLILRPSSLMVSGLGEIYGMSSGVCLSMVMLSLRLLAFLIKSEVILFYFFLSGTILFGIISCFFWKALTLILIVVLVSIGLFNLLGQYCISKSYQYGETSQLSPFSYSVIVYALILDWILYKSIPDKVSIIGMILICIGGVCTIILTTRKSNP